jgi:NitT/TauT family transport system ATP-binding protein
MNAMPAASATPRRPAAAPAPDSGDAAQCLVQIAGLQKIYKTRDGNDIHALKDIDLQIRAGEFISIVGPSGCGKTTLLKILAGILQRTAGEVVMGGRSLSGPSRELGVVFQAPVLLPWRTVLANVMVPAASSKNTRANSRAACSSASGSAGRWCTIRRFC